MTDKTPEQLAQELADAQNLIAALQAGKKPPSKLRARLKKIGASIAAALTTTEAIKAEKYLAVVALIRFAILVPGAAALIDVLVKALGGGGVTP